MNRLGMVINISHSSDATISQVIDLSDVPVIATHHGLRSVNNIPRNMPDALLKKLAAKGGVIGFQIGSEFAYPKEYEWLTAQRGKTFFDTTSIPDKVIPALTDHTTAQNFFAPNYVSPYVQTFTLGITRSLPGSEHELAARLTDQADNLVDRSEYDRADSLATEALARLRRDRSGAGAGAGADDSATARPLRVLGGALAAKGNLDQAIKLTREALALDTRYHGSTSREVAEDLNYLGAAQFQAGDLRGADSTTNASLAIWRRLDGSRVWSATPPHRAATLWRTHAH